MTASPIERVIMVYDVALTACSQEDIERALRAVSVLRQALDWEAAPELAPRLQAIYEFCEECIREKDYATAASLLRELREGWAQARASLRAEDRRSVAVGTGARLMPAGVGALNVAG